MCEREPHNVEDRYASLLAMAIAFEDTELHKGRLGPGRPSQGLKYSLIDIAETLADSLACSR